MKIALASPAIPTSIINGLEIIKTFVEDASAKQAEIICFPESFIPGYPGMGNPEERNKAELLQNALEKARAIARNNKIAIILPMDGFINDRIYNMAYVISKEGEILGYQTKNQLDPTEDNIWTSGEERRLFEINGLKFGITICHEGFRYPESVRWCAFNGAHIVFHPHFSGGNEQGEVLKTFGGIENPYYEKAMMMRSIENTIYFASVNYASKYQESATAVIAPNGSCIKHQNYGEAENIIVDIDLNLATGMLAKRFKPNLFL